jgi:hypothetical protein
VMERPDVSHVVARLSNNSVGRREREREICAAAKLP